MKLSVCVLFLVASFGLCVGIIREYSYHNTNLTNFNWNQAQWKCREQYRDLATVTTAEEHQRLQTLGERYLSGWIGFYRTDIGKNIWEWSDGQSTSLTNWATYYPLSGSSWKTNNCTSIYNGIWYNEPCYWNHPFYCYRYLILVNEYKTWAEALQHCTTNYTGLASMPSDTQLQQAKLELTLTKTVRVWTGLRFVNGGWLWLSGEPLGMLVSLPSCPAQAYRCGAFNTQTNIWENRDCNEKLNFICHWS